MAIKITHYAGMSPNRVNVGETIEITFAPTKPGKTQGLLVRIFEVDDFLPNAKPEQENTLVTFEGSVSGSTFTLSSATPGALSGTPSPNNPLKINIKTGNQTTVVFLPERERDQGIFLRLYVEGTSPKTEGGLSPVPVFVRWNDHYSVNKIKRQVVTFIAATDADSLAGNFFKNATTFWNFNADTVIVDSGISLEEIIEKMNAQFKAHGMLGQVNIVAHGNDQFIRIKLFKNSTTNALDKYVVSREISAREKQGRKLPPLQGVDGDTQIVFRACRAGQDQGLVNILHEKVFGSQGKLYIPKFYQYYWGSEYPSTSKNPYAGQTVSVCEFFYESLMKRMPVSPSNPKEWTSVLQEAWAALKDSPGWGGNFDEEVKTFNEAKRDGPDKSFPYTLPLVTKGKKDGVLIWEFSKQWDYARMVAPSDIRDTQSSDWQITVREHKESDTTTDVKFQCDRYRVERLRKLRTYDATKAYAKRKLEIPRVGNPKHYASAP